MRLRLGLALIAIAIATAASCNLAIGLGGYDFESTAGAGGTGATGGTAATAGGAGGDDPWGGPPYAGWAVGFGNGKTQLVNAVAVDLSNRVFVTGRTDGLDYEDFGCPNTSGSGTGCLIELDGETGQCLWSLFF